MYYLYRLGKYIFKKIQKMFLFDWDLGIPFLKVVIGVIYLFKSLKNATSCPERVFFCKATLLMQYF